MKQKVVIEVEMKCKKCRSKALEIAVAKDGVTSVAIKGERKNRIEVIGEGFVDAAGLAETLRKKVGFADLVSVEDVKEKST
ncbi:heavy metal-associated isoprenylated plant protein 47 [Morus notabilis]|uniref:heavy metal-associated isoprenylated plant protein 47 n=1 Tax=Morus notabilis TaxID=981085 RepID=UPI000CED26DE|nr:heavy metal-associated isoprenylated plant protein 47 [Morus notabilis]